MRLRRATVVAAALCASAGCGSPDRPADPGRSGDSRAGVVRRVVDGDTLIARIGGADVRVRMIGVDAPESVALDRPVECFGPQASARAHALLPEDAAVVFTTDPTQGEHDRFGRLLAEVALRGGARTVNERLVAEGYAEVFRGDGRARLLPRLRAAERAARRTGRGLWRACRPGG